MTVLLTVDSMVPRCHHSGAA